MKEINIEGSAIPHFVLLLDDDKSLLEVLKMILSVTTDVSALCLSSMQEVISRETDVLKCDCAIIDVNLGEGQPSGIDVYYWLRSKGCNKPIAFLTGHGLNMPEVKKAHDLEDAKVYARTRPKSKLQDKVPRRYE